MMSEICSIYKIKYNICISPNKYVYLEWTTRFLFDTVWFSKIRSIYTYYSIKESYYLSPLLYFFACFLLKNALSWEFYLKQIFHFYYEVFPVSPLHKQITNLSPIVEEHIKGHNQILFFKTNFGENPDYFYWNSLFRGDTKKNARGTCRLTLTKSSV